MQKTKNEINELFELGIENISKEERDFLFSLDPKVLTKKQNDLIKEHIISETLKIEERFNKGNSLNLLLSAKTVDEFTRTFKNEKKKRINLIVGDYLKYELETVSRMLGTSLNETINTLLDDRLKPIRELDSFKEWTELIIYDDTNKKTE